MPSLRPYYDAMLTCHSNAATRTCAKYFHCARYTFPRKIDFSELLSWQCSQCLLFEQHSRSNALDCCLVSQTLRLLLYEQASRYLDRRLQMLRDEVLTDTSLRLQSLRDEVHTDTSSCSGRKNNDGVLGLELERGS